MSSLPRSPSRGSWRGQSFNYDVMIGDPVTEELYALTFAQRRVLLAAAEILGWATRWYSDAETPIDRVLVREFCDDIIFRLMTPVTGGDMSFQLRQSPADNCLLEQSLDGGQTWITAFDYTLCLDNSARDYADREAQRVANNDRWDTLYDGTPQSIHQDCPSVYDQGTGGDLALCAAVKAYVDAQVLDTLNKYRIAAGLAAAGTGLLGSVSIIGLIPGGAVLFIIVLALADVEAAAADRVALNNVICNLKDALEGQAVTPASFQTAISGLTGNNHNEDTIIYILQGNAATEINYLYFLDLLGEAQNPAEAGVLDCPCGDWCYEFDFSTEGVQGWAGELGYTPTIQSGVGMVGTDFVNNTGTSPIGVRSASVSRQFTPSMIKSVTMIYSLVKGSLDPASSPTIGMIIDGSTVISQAAGNGTDVSAGWSVTNAVDTSEIIVTVRSSRDPSSPYSYSGSCSIKKVIVTGTGVCPFGDSNCGE